jgi:hypothetical protein
VIISAADIVSILKNRGIPDAAGVHGWLNNEFPKE